MPKAPFFSVFILLSCTVFAQQPGLDRPQEYGYDALSQAHEQYDRSNYDSANVLFFRALETQDLKAEDFLCFANSLMHRSKTALAKEFFNEYLRMSNNEYGPIADMVSAIFRKDNTRVPMSRVLPSTEQWYSLVSHRGGLYGSKEGHILGMDFDCGNTGEERIMFSAGPSIKNHGIAFYNDGFSAVVSMGVAGENSKLYVIHRRPEGWSQAKAIKFKKMNASCISPFFDEENSILYFASNAEGGMGGYDIYLSYLVKGKFQEPVNLGAHVNSFKDEIAPSVDGDWLRFSSNGYPTKGGFDLFRYRAIDDYNYVLFNERKLNSAEDEYGLIVLGTDHYLVNRYSDSLSYVVELSTPQALQNYSGIVLDEKKQPINESYALIGSEAEGRYIKSRNGTIQFQLPKNNKSVQIRIMADGYSDQQLEVEPDRSFVVQMKALESLEIIKVIDQGNRGDSSEIIYSKEDRSDSLDTGQNNKLKEGLSAPEPGQFYVIVGSARNYEDAYRSWSRWNKELEGLRIYQFNPQLFRIGFEAGSNELEALNHLRTTLKVQSDAWIIRPGTL